MISMVETKEKIKEEVKNDYGIKLEEMSEAGLHYGHKTSRIYPKMTPFTSGTRSGIHVIDLEKTAGKLKIALDYIKSLMIDKKVLVIVGTRVQAQNLAKECGVACGLPYISERWIGGTFTNFKTIQKRIGYFKDLEKKKELGELQKYTKKERVMFDKEIKKLEAKFGGIKNLDKLPDAIFVMDIKKDNLAVKEARRTGIKVIAIVNTNTDPSLIDYPIPANNETITSLKYIVEKVKETILKNK